MRFKKLNFNLISILTYDYAIFKLVKQLMINNFLLNFSNLKKVFKHVPEVKCFCYKM